MMRCLQLLFLGSLGPLLFAQTGNASIQGEVQSADGHSIPGAVIVARTQAPKITTAGKALSDKNGHFAIANLPAGTYSLCTLVGQMIDPCLWSTASATVTVAAGQTITGRVISLANASLLRVHLSDPSQLLKTPTANGKSTNVLLGIWTPTKFFLPLTKTSEDASGRDYQVAIPFDTPLSLTVLSGALQLNDNNNQPVPAQGVSVPVQHASGQPEPAPLAFTVTGVAH